MYVAGFVIPVPGEKLDAYRQTRNQIRDRMLARFGPPLPDEDYDDGSGEG